MKTVDQARVDVATVIPHLREAAEDAKRRAKDGAVIMFAIIAKNPDGSGQIGATFPCDEFLTDMETVFPPSEDAVMEAKAACILSKIG